ncbi:MAG TPA: hypothetical protein VGN31_01080 [Paraburkholderia sp.]|jgi:hypothetical protein
MIVLPALHGQVHVEPGRSGSPESHAHSPRIDTARFQRGSQADAEPVPRETGTVASGLRAPAGAHAAGRLCAAGPATRGTIGGLLPDAYIGMPRGDLRSDPQNTRVLTDETGQRYIAAGKHYYAVRNDPANRTWRVVQLQDRAKPGIPVQPGSTGEWQVRHEIGVPGGRPLPTRAQIENDHRETEATLADLVARRRNVQQDIRDDRNLIRRFEAFQLGTRADRQSIRNDIDFWQGRSEYFTRAAGHNAADPSFQTALEHARRQIERNRTSMQGLQRLIDESDTHIDALRSRFEWMSADLQHIRESIPRANHRLAELASQLNDFE